MDNLTVSQRTRFGVSDSVPTMRMEEKVRRFFGLLFGDADTVTVGSHELPDSRGIRRMQEHQIEAADLSDYQDESWSSSGDVFFTPVPVMSEEEQESQGHLRTVNRGAVLAQPGHALFFDFDQGISPEHQSMFEDLQASIVYSGSLTPDGSPKAHVYLHLAERMDPREIKWLCGELVRRWGADPACVDVARFLRIPGTLNHKASPPRPVTLEHVGEAWPITDLYSELGILKRPSAEELPDLQGGRRASTEEVQAFRERSTGLAGKTSGLIQGHVNWYRKAVGEGQSRHEAMTSALCWAAREAQQNRVCFGEAVVALRELFESSLQAGSSRSFDPAEFDGMVAWAVGSLPASPADGETDSTEDAEQTRVQRVAAMKAKLLTTKQIRDLPRPRWLVKGWLTQNTLARMNGKPGSYKSFIALDLAAHVTTGRDWHGSSVKQGKVLYLVAEGVDGFSKRVEAWEMTFAEAEGLMIYPEPVQVMSGSWLDFIDLCVEYEPSLIILDTQSRITMGVEENSSKEMTEVIERWETLRKRTGACVLVIHHTGHNGEHGRGSSSVFGALNTEFTVSKKVHEDGTTVVSLENGKEKDEAEGSGLAFLPSVVDLGEDENGELVSSVVLSPASIEKPTRAEVGRTRTQRIQAHILNYIETTDAKFCTKSKIRDAVKKSVRVGQKGFNAEFDALARVGHIVQTGSGDRSPWAVNPDGRTLRASPSESVRTDGL